MPKRIRFEDFGVFKALVKRGIAGGTVWIFYNNGEPGGVVLRLAGTGTSRGGGAVLDGPVDFAVLFEQAVFALKGAFGGGFVAKHKIVLLDLLGGPVEWRDALGGAEKRIIVALIAEAVPFGLGGFEDEIIHERIFGGLVGLAPAAEKEQPGLFGFTGEDEGMRAGTVLGGILRRDGATFSGSGSGAAGVAFFGFGVGIEHVILSRVSWEACRAAGKKLGKWLIVGRRFLREICERRNEARTRRKRRRR
jgi:hypothetical protein